MLGRICVGGSRLIFAATGRRAAKSHSSVLSQGCRSVCASALPSAFGLSGRQSQKGQRPRSVRTYSTKLVDVVKLRNQEGDITVYSKTWCPFCSDVKTLLSKLNLDFDVVELDLIEEGDDVQDALYELSGIRTVPQVFIKDRFLGGCDDTYAAYKSGDLKTALEDAGISANI